MRRMIRAPHSSNFLGEAQPRKAKPATEGGVFFAEGREFDDLTITNFPKLRQRVKWKLRFR